MADPDRVLADWLARLSARADAPALAPRVALTCGPQQLRIGSLDAGLAQRLGDAELPLRSHSTGWQVLAPVDASLALIARWLHTNGLGGRWRNELLAVTAVLGVMALGFWLCALALRGRVRRGV